MQHALIDDVDDIAVGARGELRGEIARKKDRRLGMHRKVGIPELFIITALRKSRISQIRVCHVSQHFLLGGQRPLHIRFNHLAAFSSRESGIETGQRGGGDGIRRTQA